MNIAIIDSGLDLNNRSFQKKEIKGIHLFLNLEGKISYDMEIFDEQDGHGTGIAEIINAVVPEATLIVVKLSSFDGKLTEALITAALMYCEKNFEIDIYNISLGIITQHPGIELYEICKRITLNGKQIISSAHYHPNLPCFPAYFPFVWSVAAGATTEKLSDFLYLGKGNVNIIGHGVQQRIKWAKNKMKKVAGSSYATARFTGALTKLILESDSKASQIEYAITQASSNAVKQIYYIDKINRERMEEILFIPQQSAIQKVYYPITDKKYSAYKRALKGTKSLPRLLLDQNDQNNATANHCTIDELVKQDIKDICVLLGDVYNAKVDEDLLEFVDLCDALLRKDFNISCLHTRVFNFLTEKITQLDLNYLGTLKDLSIPTVIFTEVPNINYSISSSPIIIVCGIDSTQNLILTSKLTEIIRSNYPFNPATIATCSYGMVAESEFCIPYQSDNSELPNLRTFENLVHSYLKKMNADILFSYDQGTPKAKYLNNTIYENKATAMTMNYLTAIVPDLIIFNLAGKVDQKKSIDYIATIISFLKLGPQSFMIAYDNFTNVASLKDNFEKFQACCKINLSRKPGIKMVAAEIINRFSPNFISN